MWSTRNQGTYNTIQYKKVINLTHFLHFNSSGDQGSLNKWYIDQLRLIPINKTIFFQNKDQEQLWLIEKVICDEMHAISVLKSFIILLFIILSPCPFLVEHNRSSCVRHLYTEIKVRTISRLQARFKFLILLFLEFKHWRSRKLILNKNLRKP